MERNGEEAARTALRRRGVCLRVAAALGLPDVSFLAAFLGRESLRLIASASRAAAESAADPAWPGSICPALPPIDAVRLAQAGTIAFLRAAKAPPHVLPRSLLKNRSPSAAAIFRMHALGCGKGLLKSLQSTVLTSEVPMFCVRERNIQHLFAPDSRNRSFFMRVFAKCMSLTKGGAARAALQELAFAGFAGAAVELACILASDTFEGQRWFAPTATQVVSFVGFSTKSAVLALARKIPKTERRSSPRGLLPRHVQQLALCALSAGDERLLDALIPLPRNKPLRNTSRADALDAVVLSRDPRRCARRIDQLVFSERQSPLAPPNAAVVRTCARAARMITHRRPSPAAVLFAFELIAPAGGPCGRRELSSAAKALTSACMRGDRADVLQELALGREAVRKALKSIAETKRGTFAVGHFGLSSSTARWLTVAFGPRVFGLVSATAPALARRVAHITGINKRATGDLDAPLTPGEHPLARCYTSVLRAVRLSEDEPPAAAAIRILAIVSPAEPGALCSAAGSRSSAVDALVLGAMFMSLLCGRLVLAFLLAHCFPHLAVGRISVEVGALRIHSGERRWSKGDTSGPDVKEEWRAAAGELRKIDLARPHGATLAALLGLCFGMGWAEKRIDACGGVDLRADFLRQWALHAAEFASKSAVLDAIDRCFAFEHTIRCVALLRPALEFARYSLGTSSPREDTFGFPRFRCELETVAAFLSARRRALAAIVRENQI